APVTIPDRNNQSHSLNFLLPDAWTVKEGLALHLRVQLDTRDGRITWMNNENTDPFQAPPFKKPPNWPATFTVYTLPVCAAIDDEKITCPPELGDLSGVLETLYPVSNGAIEYSFLAAPVVFPAKLGIAKDASVSDIQEAVVGQLRLTMFLQRL